MGNRYEALGRKFFSINVGNGSLLNDYNALGIGTDNTRSTNYLKSSLNNVLFEIADRIA